MASSGIIFFLDLIYRANAHHSGSLFLHFLDEPSDSFADANAKKDRRREVQEAKVAHILPGPLKPSLSPFC